MITSSGIVFNHSRKTNSINSTGQVIMGGLVELGELPLMGIKSIVINKQAQNLYMQWDNQKSYYLPTGMIGPSVKLVCDVIDSSEQSLLNDTTTGEQNGLYSNDLLTITEFNFPIWNTTLAVGSQWWMDSLTFGTPSLSAIHNGILRYDIELNLYRKD